jgi:hypothetical protein
VLSLYFTLWLSYQHVNKDLNYYYVYTLLYQVSHPFFETYVIAIAVPQVNFQGNVTVLGGVPPATIGTCKTDAGPSALPLVQRPGCCVHGWAESALAAMTDGDARGYRAEGPTGRYRSGMCWL